jgi:hypothetical protein
MDPDMFGGLMSMFAPKPGQDPFALGTGLATNPDAFVNDLAKMGPPPASGQGFPDYVAQKAAPAMPAPQGPPMPGGGPPGFPAPAMPPRPGVPSAAGVGTDLSNAFQAAFPGAGARMGRETPSGMDLAGDQPSPLAPGAPGTQPPPIPAGLQTAAAPPPTQGARPDILAPLGTAPAASPQPPNPAQIKMLQDSLKASGSLLSGVKAPPPPTTQHISSPSPPRPNPMQGGDIAALIRALTGGAGTGAPPLRLGNALLAGGRGLY